MTRLLVHVEGQTEEAFVNQVLAPHLYNKGYTNIGARLLGNARQRDRRGGIRPWSTVRGDILRHLHEDRECLSTTMVDYYALPATGPGAWPGRAAAAADPLVDAEARAALVEDAIAKDITADMGGEFDRSRFLPFIVMHEFEGLLFSDCIRFAEGIGKPELAVDFGTIRSQFVTPEDINDSPVTAPSKRLASLLPGYQKPLNGTLGAQAIGLDRIREECPHFRAWVEQLEDWALRRTHPAA